MRIEIPCSLLQGTSNGRSILPRRRPRCKLSRAGFDGEVDLFHSFITEKMTGHGILRDSQYHRTAMRRTANFRVSSASSSAAAKGMSTSQALNGSGEVLKTAWPQGW